MVILSLWVYLLGVICKLICVVFNFHLGRPTKICCRHTGQLLGHSEHGLHNFSSNYAPSYCWKIKEGQVRLTDRECLGVDCPHISHLSMLRLSVVSVTSVHVQHT